MDAADPGGLGGTYAGSPLAIAAALAVLEVIEEEKLIERANHIGAKLKTKLEAIAQRNDSIPIGAIRGPGAMVAFDIVATRGTYEPDAEMTKRVIGQSPRAWADPALLRRLRNSIRLLVPLTASDELLNEALGILETALTV